MPWSPSQARSLPSLRPGQVSPATASRGRLTGLTPSQLDPSPRNTHSSKLENAPEPQSLHKPTTTRAQSSGSLHLSTATKRKETPTNHGPDPPRPTKAPRIPSRSLKNEPRPLPSSSNNAHNLLASAPITNRPFFSLTAQELKALRRSMGKGSSYKRFRDTTIARELDRLGRGWDGYLRAKGNAEQEGKVGEFWRHLSLELSTALSTTKFPAGAISIEAAAIATQSNYISSVGKLRPESAAELRRLRAKSWSSHPSSSLADLDSDTYNSRNAQLPSISPPAAEHDSNVRQYGSPGPVLVSRPRRNLKRPNYKIPPLLESSPAPPSSPDVPCGVSSPTPREIYDRIQPKFIEYPCKWSGCQASLNNLETLQKHFRIVHAEEARDTLRCRWGACGTGTPRAYESVHDLGYHFDASHLTPLKWRLGDGQKGHGIVAKAPVA